MKAETQYVNMSDGVLIALHSWIPEGDIKAVVQISHGMAEYAKRYAHFAETLCGAGIAVFAHDHRGHGDTAGKDLELGFLAEKDGFKRVMLDLRELIGRTRSEYPGKKIILFAHSFGSFIAQLFIEQYGYEVHACILSGTAGPQKGLAALTKMLAGLIGAVKGSHFHSNLMSALAFGPYNKRIKNPASFMSWLSRDDETVRAYDASPLCGFVPAVRFYYDLGTGLSLIHLRKNMIRIPQTLPVLFIAGTEDPVGSYNKTIKKLASMYRKNGIKDVSEKYYDGGRHEMLNEINRSEVEQYILSWIHLKI